MPINMNNLTKKKQVINIDAPITKQLSYRDLSDMIKGHTFNEAQSIIHSNYKIPKLKDEAEFNSIMRKLEKNLNDSEIRLTASIAVELCVQKAQLDYAFPIINNPFSMMAKIKYSELSERYLALEVLEYTIR